MHFQICIHIYVLSHTYTRYFLVLMIKRDVYARVHPLQDNATIICICHCGIMHYRIIANYMYISYLIVNTAYNTHSYTDGMVRIRTLIVGWGMCCYIQ